MTATQNLQLPIDNLLEQTAVQARREVDTLRAYLKNLPEKGWLKQSFCTDWTIEDVVEHQIVQGLLFRDNTRLLIRGQEPLPFSPEVVARYEADFTDLNRLERADLLADTTYELYDILEGASPEQLQGKMALLIGDVPLAILGSMRLSELSLHSWDIRVVDNLSTKISRESLPLLFPGLLQVLPRLANREMVKQSGDLTYEFEIDGPVKGPVTVSLAGGKVRVQSDYAEKADVRLKLDADSFLRLSWGRLRNLDRRIKEGWVKLDGDLDTALRLNQLFQGI